MTRPAVALLLLRRQLLKLFNCDQRRRSSVAFPVAVVAVMKRMTARPGMLRNRVDNAQQEANGTVKGPASKKEPWPQSCINEKLRAENSTSSATAGTVNSDSSRSGRQIQGKQAQSSAVGARAVHNCQTARRLSGWRKGASENSPRFRSWVWCKEEAVPDHQVRCITCSGITLMGVPRQTLLQCASTADAAEVGQHRSLVAEHTEKVEAVAADGGVVSHHHHALLTVEKRSQG